MFRSPKPIFSASTIAIVGASERARWPQTIWQNLKANGYAGKVYPINPRRDEVYGVPCYHDFGSLPEPADLALVIVPAAAVQGVIEDGARHGLKAATVYAGHLGEGTDPEIVGRGAALKALCEEAGIALAGPNCMGGIAFREKLFAYPNGGICKPSPGSVAAVFQSGGTLQFWVQTAQSRGLRFSYAMSSGNEIGLDLADYINFFVDDPETRIIVLFIEGIRRPEIFKAACTRALAASKPIIAIKTGRTQRAREAALSHTGAIGGDWQAFEALCERYGIVSCPSLDDMTETALAFSQGRLPEGGGIGFVTTSGGTVDLLYDYAEAEGVSMPDFQPETVARMRPLLPKEMTPKNPLDSGIPAGNDLLAELCAVALDDPATDILAVAGQISTGRADIAAGAPMGALVDRTTKPVIGFGRMRYHLGEDGIAYQDAIGIPYLQGLPETLRALAGLVFYGARAGRTIAPLPAPAGTPENLEGDAFADLLAANGVTLPNSVLAEDGAAAAEAAAAIGFPVVLKVVAPAFSHKTEVGGVLLGLSSADEVCAGAATLAGRIAAADANAEITGFLVQEMVSGVEMIVGARDDALYGPVILVGTGGIMVELMGDAAMRLLPVDEDDVRAMIAELKGRELLAGFRGAPAADTDALVAAVVGLGRVYLDHRHLLADLEVNPLIVRQRGAGVAAVDVRPVRRSD
ncbi:MAG: CoA-binding protein [Alphaproteobacteria bacterium]|nr:acetate--CoA ligase family protein [Pseudomonadota bacterium]TDI63793.1 MAG: CoA-binding protein [Alphaproteobacteria bacterium]